MPESRRILYCHCRNGAVVPDETRAAVLDALSGDDTTFEAVGDLCGLAARAPGTLRHLADTDRLIVLACYPRAVRALFAAAGVALPADVVIVNLRTQPVDEVLAAIAPAGADGREASAP